MNQLITDTELIIRFNDGDEEAFDELVGRYLVPIYRYIFTFVPEKDIAQEITQEVIIKVWKNSKKYTPSKPFKPWIYTIARNTALDEIKRKKIIAFSGLHIHEDISFEESLADEALLPDALIEQARTKDYIERVLNEYSKEKREIILLHLYEGLTFQEISTLTGSPLNTVKSTFRRTALDMKNKLEKLINN